MWKEAFPRVKGETEVGGPLMKTLFSMFTYEAPARVSSNVSSTSLPLVDYVVDELVDPFDLRVPYLIINVEDANDNNTPVCLNESAA